MKNKKLSEKELQLLSQYQNQSNETIVALGGIELQLSVLETQKENVLKEFKSLQEDQTKTGKELQDKYGEGNISLENGEFTPKK